MIPREHVLLVLTFVLFSIKRDQLTTSNVRELCDGRTLRLRGDYFWPLSCIHRPCRRLAWHMIHEHRVPGKVQIILRDINQLRATADSDGGCDVFRPSALFKYRFARPTASHRRMRDISANPRELV